MSSSMIHFKVTGLVQARAELLTRTNDDMLIHQGVCFRAFTQKQGDKLGLKGWVKNMPDSSVEGMAVGQSDALEAFRQKLGEGPSAAKVKAVELLEQKEDVSEEVVQNLLGKVRGFEIQ